MVSLSAGASLIATVAIVLARPRLFRDVRAGPATAAAAGVGIMLVTGLVSFADVAAVALELWRPLVTVAAIMATTALAQRCGIFDRLARRVEKTTRGPVHRAFATVFAISAACSAVFNNDAAVLMLTPLLVPLVKRLYPVRQYLVVPFSFAVFMGAGVAPLATSNPMNLVVAERAGIGFNEYAVRMIPVAMVGWIVSYAMLRAIFRSRISDAIPAGGGERGSLPPLAPGARRLLVVLAVVLGSYPIVSYFDGPVWVIATAGAAVAVLVTWHAGSATPRDAAQSVAWNILAFLFGAFVLGAGLRNAGVIDALAGGYASFSGGTRVAIVGASAAAGSAMLNNHPMAILNALAVERLDGDTRVTLLAALVGGDLGPRLLPMGSLAGLLWMDLMRRAGVEISMRQFCTIGAIVAVPTIAACLGVLWLLSG